MWFLASVPYLPRWAIRIFSWNHLIKNNGRTYAFGGALDNNGEDVGVPILAFFRHETVPSTQDLHNLLRLYGSERVYMLIQENGGECKEFSIDLENNYHMETNMSFSSGIIVFNHHDYDDVDHLIDDLSSDSDSDEHIIYSTPDGEESITALDESS